MKLKTFFMTAIMCGALFVGLSGTTSAAELSKDFSTLNVITQELAARRVPIFGGHRYNPSHHRDRRHYDPPRHHDYDRTGSRNRYDRERYDRNRYNRNRDRYDRDRNRNVNINVSITRRR